MAEKNHFASLFRRRQCIVPTWRGWLVLVLVFVTGGVMGLRCVYPFLASNDPTPGGVLVVEGWLSDYVLDYALTEITTRRFTSPAVLWKWAPFFPNTGLMLSVQPQA